MEAVNTIYSGRPVAVCYDGTWPGLLTAVFETFAKKWQVTSFQVHGRECQTNFLAEKADVISDDEKAARVWQGLRRKVPSENCIQLYRCFLSEMKGVELTILSCVQFYFSGAESPHQAYGHPDVLKINQISKMVYREKHRMEAFVRFQRTSDDLYYAVIEPDFDVIPLLSKHFEERYADQNWLIYDIRRKYGIYYDQEKVSEIILDLKQETHTSCNFRNILHDSEPLYQGLWKDYFKHVNIPSRRNIKLHLQHVPKRYWKHLVEKK
ncbi:hypothetical protein DYBT9275_04093 [Dyadobacter sp. CECT 9275]|uniref:DUF4130 domain-containing protein n=1 Tax=Dyadobacter helix TaxID=2822344 RepID=A0A916N798_9BACT|nr:TIGR03915 family putative DNA repair protein [Dyadobacter sp. CECT 9275]CAG5007639.1 hypothetical protein DYBT9275_04093 [Dyadobacter sp. CECT 9275]